jgi:hypothetical protein
MMIWYWGMGNPPWSSQGKRGMPTLVQKLLVLRIWLSMLWTKRWMQRILLSRWGIGFDKQKQRCSRMKFCKIFKTLHCLKSKSGITITCTGTTTEARWSTICSSRVSRKSTAIESRNAILHGRFLFRLDVCNHTHAYDNVKTYALQYLQAQHPPNEHGHCDVCRLIDHLLVSNLTLSFVSDEASGRWTGIRAPPTRLSSGNEQNTLVQAPWLFVTTLHRWKNKIHHIQASIYEDGSHLLFWSVIGSNKVPYSDIANVLPRVSELQLDQHAGVERNIGPARSSIGRSNFSKRKQLKALYFVELENAKQWCPVAYYRASSILSVWRTNDLM